MQGSLTSEEINILLGRRQGLEEFEQQMRVQEWGEKEWQDFFDRQQWVFGYGLDYRIMRQFGREMTVGAGGTDIETSRRSRRSRSTHGSNAGGAVVTDLEPDCRLSALCRGAPSTAPYSQPSAR
jgi:hypothetical protein